LGNFSKAVDNCLFARKNHRVGSSGKAIVKIQAKDNKLCGYLWIGKARSLFEKLIQIEIIINQIAIHNKGKSIEPTQP
jgi:hypothetical protein